MVYETHHLSDGLISLIVDHLTMVGATPVSITAPRDGAQSHPRYYLTGSTTALYGHETAIPIGSSVYQIPRCN